ncbi:hypothetical protein [Tateyamaria pelophila]|uniref:hypothetical protein n=1 Tax=Tateyamaria pelophila TaxID=328415 RepID=UPI001CC0397B|nr:hypothetical protein [Tateyamaria pelophila]
MTALLRRRDLPYRPHGFRASFRTWAEETGHRNKQAIKRAWQYQMTAGQPVKAFWTSAAQVFGINLPDAHDLFHRLFDHCVL